MSPPWCVLLGQQSGIDGAAALLACWYYGAGAVGADAARRHRNHFTHLAIATVG
jgi:hypothetical protein